MKKFATAIAFAAGLAGSPVMAAEDPVWGPWASTDDNALAVILAGAESAGGNDAVPGLGPEDSALLDVGSLLAGLEDAVGDAGNGLPICLFSCGAGETPVVDPSVIVGILGDPEAALADPEGTAEALAGALGL